MSTAKALPGLYRALVETAADPDGVGRVKLRIPQVLGTEGVTDWAWPTLQGGEAPRPVDAGDSVWAAFEGGSLNDPVYLAAPIGLGAALDPQTGVQLFASSLTTARNLVFTNPEAKTSADFWTAIVPATLERITGTGSPVGAGNAIRASWPAGSERGAVGLALQYGTTNSGRMPIPLKAGVQYTVSFYARAQTGARYHYSLTALDGSNLISTVKHDVIGTAWARYNLTFFARQDSAPTNRLLFVPDDLDAAATLDLTCLQIEVGPNASAYSDDTARMVLDTTGLSLFGADGTRNVFLDAATGTLTASNANLSGALTATSLTAQNAALTGTLRLGSLGRLLAGGTDDNGTIIDGGRVELDARGLRYITRVNGLDLPPSVSLGADGAAITDAAISSVSASKIVTGQLNVGTRIIAGPAGDNHAEVSSTGFSVWTRQPDDTVPTQVIQLGTAGSDFFGVTDHTGKQVAGIDQDGAASFSRLDVDSTISLGGRDLADVISSTGGRVLGWGDPGPGTGGVDARTNSEMGFVEVLVEVPPSSTGARAMQVMWEGTEIQANTGDSAEIRLRRTATSLDKATCPAVTVNSELIRAQLMAPIRSSWSGTGASQTWFHMQACSTTDTTYMRMLVSVAPVNGTTELATFRGRSIGFLVVFDMGEGTSSSGGYSTGGGIPVTGTPAAPPAQKQQYLLEVPSTWQQTFRGNGSVRGDTTDVVQGYYDSTNGDGKGLIGFRDITPDLAGSHVDHVEIYLYANHWYYNSGGTAIIGAHGHTGPPGSFTGPIRQNMLRSTGWPKPGGRWLNFSFSEGDLDAWRLGAYRGIVLGAAGTTDRSFYGRFSAGTAILRVWYTK